MVSLVIVVVVTILLDTTHCIPVPNAVCEGMDLCDHTPSIFKMASESTVAKQLRKANYSASESLFLAEKYDEFKEVIDSQHKDAGTNNWKCKAWESIFEQHKARFPKVDRTRDELKQKLFKLKMEARENLQQQKKARAKTGGGSLWRNLQRVPYNMLEGARLVVLQCHKYLLAWEKGKVPPGRKLNVSFNDVCDHHYTLT